MDADVERQIVGLERALLAPETRHSTEWLDGVLADAMIEFGKSGKVYDKAALIAGLVAEPPSPIMRFEIVDAHATVLAAEVVLLTYRLEPIVQDADTPVASLRSSIWRREAGNWRMVFHQGTAIAG